MQQHAIKTFMCNTELICVLAGGLSYRAGMKGRVLREVIHDVHVCNGKETFLPHQTQSRNVFLNR